MKSYRRIKSVETMCEILKFLSEQKNPVTGQDIARAMDLPHGTVMCQLITAKDVDFVKQNDGKFELGQGVAKLWAAYRSKLDAKIEDLQKELKQLEV